MKGFQRMVGHSKQPSANAPREDQPYARRGQRARPQRMIKLAHYAQ